MRAAIGLMALTWIGGLCAGCASVDQVNPFQPRQAGYSTEFIAGNPNNVLIDYAQGSDQELDAARKLADNRCALFGRNHAVLESVDVRGDGKDRATFLCQ
jgi:hypothetical protein